MPAATAAAPARRSWATWGPAIAAASWRDAGAISPGFARAMAGTPLLSAEEERALADRLAAGRRPGGGLTVDGGAARDRLVGANLRLVVRVARGYAGRGLGLDDLIGAGAVGLVVAVDRFEPDRGVRLASYASLWIKESIASAVADGAPDGAAPIRLPQHLAQRDRAYHRTRAALARRDGREPGFDAVADAMGLDARERDTLAAGHAARSLRRVGGGGPDDPEGAGFGGAGAISLDQLAVAAPEPGPGPGDDDDDGADARARLAPLVALLPERERRVILARFGLTPGPDGAGDGREWTLAELAAVLGVTRERVRQLEAQALRRLRVLAEGGDGAVLPPEGADGRPRVRQPRRRPLAASR
jgi:RNA polymerase primary sigma factor